MEVTASSRIGNEEFRESGRKMERCGGLCFQMKITIEYP
jgi:hypothetical protein